MPPVTEAERRAEEVRRTRAPREKMERPAPPPWEREQWVDEGSVRDEAERATARAADTGAPKPRRRMSTDLAPEVAADLAQAAPAARQARYQERLASAADALDRGRFADAKRMVQPVLRDLPDLAFGHEIAGLALYRMGQWRKAVAELELARQLGGSFEHLAVLADCYRALRRYHEVDVLWREMKEASPEPAVMAEGRIVAAGALADQGDLVGALKIMQRAAESTKKPKEHHLKQWYVLADLYDRSGEVITARRFFQMVVEVDPEFADAGERLRALGR